MKPLYVGAMFAPKDGETLEVRVETNADGLPKNSGIEPRFNVWYRQTDDQATYGQSHLMREEAFRILTTDVIGLSPSVARRLLDLAVVAFKEGEQ